MLTVWGLKTCDTCKKAVKWLSDEGIVHAVKDVRADGVPASELARWVDALGWEAVVNKSSTTWRGLPDADKNGLDAAKAKVLLAAHPTLIKRPVFISGKDIVIGFRDAQKSALKAGA